ncbi:hypothetical protein D1007_32242 [Hordeum vulgare]|nr:hypothetical protein D1007_32242 [Hordeum vulgare]
MVGANRHGFLTTYAMGWLINSGWGREGIGGLRKWDWEQAVQDTRCTQEREAAGMKRKLTKTGFKSPYDSDYDDDDPYEYNSGDDVEDGNKESFIEKEAQKIKKKGKATYYKRGMFRCPYCTTKPKPMDGIYEHLMSHARGLATSAADIKTRAEHAALLKALGPI